MESVLQNEVAKGEGQLTKEVTEEIRIYSKADLPNLLSFGDDTPRKVVQRPIQEVGLLG